MTTNPITLAGVELSCIRDDRVLFEALNFTVHAGQVLLLEGKNGSGKTSLLRILCGFREADAGRVLWCGEDIDDSRYYADMAYVGHLDGIKKELTVLENLNVSLALGSPGRFSLAEALEKVHLAGYDDVPFTSLDKAGIALIESLMREHCAEGGMIVLTSHHDIDLHNAVVQRVHLS
jgi:heme exporter protein A